MATRCYFCLAEQPQGKRSSCVACGRTLELPPTLATMGRAYLLNSLDAFVADGSLDEGAAQHIREIVLAGASQTEAKAPLPAAATPERREPTITLGSAVAPARPSASESVFAPERAPSLLLYVGAFLLVVAALIFVNVSGRQISDALRLALLAAGTIGFIGVGLLCHRIPRVLEAGRTFLAIGALLVPLDVLAYYALVARVPPASAPAMWAIGSLLAAGLYAVLAGRAYGKGYAYLALVASLSSIAGLIELFDVTYAWAGVPYLVLGLSLELVSQRAGWTPLSRITSPLVGPNRLLVAFVLLSGVLVNMVVAETGTDRWGLVAMTTIATLYYAVRTTLGRRWDRPLAIAGPATIVLALLFVGESPLRTYGLALAVISVAYAVVAEADSLGLPIVIPTWIRDRSRLFAYGWIAGALLLVREYWPAPAMGAAAFLVSAVVLGALAIRRHSAGLVAAGAVALHVGALYLLVALGVLPGGRSPFAEIRPREIAIVFAPLATGLGILAAIVRHRLPGVSRPLFVAGIASAAFSVLGALGDPALATTLGLVAASGLVAAACLVRGPSILWIATAFAAFAFWSLGRWLRPPEELIPLALAAVGLALFAPAFLPRYRSTDFATVIRQIALLVAVSGFIYGLAFTSLASPRAPWDRDLWLATVPALLTFGALGAANALHQRSEGGVVAATVCVLGAVLMLVARVHPTAIEAYTLPIATYLALVAIGIALFGSARLRDELGPIVEIACVVALTGPSVGRAFAGVTGERDLHASLVLLEGLATLAIGLVFGRQALATAAVAALGVGALWIIQDPTARQLYGIAAGGALIGGSLAAVRFLPSVRAERTLLLSELVGPVLFLVPTLLASWVGPFLPATPLAFLLIGLLLATSILFRRRWLLAAALAATGLVALRATLDVVDRLPNWALFGASGALLLAAGFVLLLKREAWNAWSRRVYRWWAAL